MAVQAYSDRLLYTKGRVTTYSERGLYTLAEALGDSDRSVYTKGIEAAIIATITVASDASQVVKAMVKSTEWREGTSGSWLTTNCTLNASTTYQFRTPLSGMSNASTAILPNIKASVTVDWDTTAAPVSTLGKFFMFRYANGCSNLTSLSVPDTSGITSVGFGFMEYCANGCTSLTSLDVPDISGLTSAGTYFMGFYAQNCSSLTSLSVPDTSGLTSAGDNFMSDYASGCSNLTSLSVPDTSGLTSVGNSFMYYYAYGCSGLTSLILPDSTGWFGSHNVDWFVPSTRLGYLNGIASSSSAGTAWEGLIDEGETLYTNYIRSVDNVLIGASSDRLLYTKGRVTTYSERGLYTRGRITVGDDSVTVCDSYSESNHDSNLGLDGGYLELGQSFEGDGRVLSSVKFYLMKTGSPTGNAVAKIYTHTGTYGTSSLPTGSALATSDTFDVSTLGTSHALKEFTFSGTNKITLEYGTHYIVTIDYLGGSTNKVLVGIGPSSSTHLGNAVYRYSGGWAAASSMDFCFYVYTTTAIGRLLYTKGGLAGDSDRLLYSKGISTGSSDRGLFSKGIASSDSDRLIYTKGIATSSSDRLLYSKGKVAGSSDRPLYTEGAAGGSSDRAIYSSGVLKSSSDRFIYTIGVDTSSSDRRIYTYSVELGSSERDLYTIGIGSGSSEISIYTEGFETDSSERGVYSRGGIPSSSTRSLYIKGTWKPWVDKFVEYGTIYTDEKVVVSSNWVDVKASATDNFIRKV